MNKLSQRLDAFCARNSRRGIPNLMLYITVGSAIVYILTLMDPTYTVYRLLAFDRGKILSGQVWRLVTFLFATAGLPNFMDLLLTLISFYFYYQCGKLIERHTGTLKFNLYYFSGAVLMAAAGLLTGWPVHSSSLHLSLLLAFALLYGEARILLMMILPIKAKVIGWVYIVLMLLECVRYFSLLPLIPLVPLVLFFWEQLPTLLPASWRRKLADRRRAKARPQAKPNPNWAAGYQRKSGKKAYHHKCTVCGRTDTENPGLDFRYCSRCSGYRCYCMDHINDHAHIVDTE